MATLPLSGSNVRLLRGIPFNSDYKHTRWFDSKSEQTNYFLSKQVVHTMDKANFQRIEGKGYIAVNKGIDALWGVNYLMFKNATYPSKWFYAFVTKIEYKQKTTTYVYFEIDVFQTWKFDMDFKPSYVIREHQKLWNADGTPVINTVDEGLDYGTDYDTLNVHHIKPSREFKWLVMVCKKPMQESDFDVYPSIVGTPQALTYYVVPFSDEGETANVEVGGTLYTELSGVTQVLEKAYTNENAINNIVSIYVTDYIGIPFTVDGNTLTESNDSSVVACELADIGGANVLHILYVNEFIPKIIESHSVFDIGASPKESKLLMSPYHIITLTDFKGNQVDFKPEYINSDKIKVVYKGSIGTSNNVSFGLMNYNYHYTGYDTEITNEFAGIDNSPNEVPILNDNLAAFLQGNRNTLKNQKNSTMFNGVANGVGGLLGTLGSIFTGNVNGAMQGATNMVKGAGNTVLGLQQIQAKKQDIANVPPHLSRMGSNTSYDYGNRYNGVFLMVKFIKREYREKLEDFFNMYGYKINEVKIPNFHTRKYWNYVQTGDCVVRGNFNNEDLVELKSVFDNGITFWHTDDVGNYALNNEVI